MKPHQSFTDLMNGGKFDGFKLVAGRTTTRWLDGAQDYVELAYGEKAYERKFVGVTAARKFMRKDEIEQFTYQATGEPKMVHESEKGEPIEIVGFDNLND